VTNRAAGEILKSDGILAKTFGETVADAFGLVFCQKSDGKLYRAKANAEETSSSQLYACVDAATVMDAPGNVLVRGALEKTGWTWTIGSPIYISAATAGALTQTRPAYPNTIREIGCAVTATQIYFAPDGILPAEVASLMDAVASAAQGDIVYRGASTYERLAAGDRGKVLQTGGREANPSWIYPVAGIPISNYSGTPTEQFAAAQIAAEAAGLPIRIPADTSGDLEYDPAAVSVDIYDERLAAGKHYGLIPTIQTDLSAMRHRPTLKMVVTGDSISYNRYDYDETARANAEAGRYGYKSWAYLIRDAFLRGLPGWCGVGDLLIGSASTADIKYEAGGFVQYYLPLDERRIGGDFDIGETLEIYIPPSVVSDPKATTGVGPLYLYFLTSPTAEAGVFSATAYNAVTGVQIGNPVTFSNEGDGTYLDYALKSVCLGTAIRTSTPVRVQITLDTKSGAQNTVLSLIGVAVTEFTWVHTGQGSTTTEWLATNVQTLVVDHTPDIVLILSGANDIGAGLTETQTYQNLCTTVEAIRAANPYTEIVLVSQPPSSTRPDAQCLARVRAVRRVAGEYDCGFIDAFSVLRRTDPTYWRFDNIHLSQMGNQILFEAIAKTFFPSLDITLCNQRNIQGASGIYSEQTPRNALWRWRPYLPADIAAVYATATGRIQATTELDAWGNVYTRPFAPVQIPAKTLLNGADAVSDKIRIAENGGRVELTVQNPFHAGWLSPRLIPAPILVDDGTNEPIVLIEASRSGSATIYTVWTWADVTETDSGTDASTVRELVQITSLSDIPDGAALRLSFVV
jgi:hypothetical protein